MRFSGYVCFLSKKSVVVAIADGKEIPFDYLLQDKGDEYQFAWARLVGRKNIAI